MAISILRSSGNLNLFYLKSLKSLKLIQPPESEFWIYLRHNISEQAQDGNIGFDFYVCDENERLLMSVEELRLKQFALQEALTNITYTTLWKPLDDELLRQPPRSLANRWLIFDDHSSRAQLLCRQLKQKGYECFRIFAADENTISEDLTVRLNPAKPAEAKPFLEKLIENNTEIVYFWNSLESIQREEVLTFLLNDLKQKPDVFWMVTHSAVNINGQTEAPDSFQAFLSDLALWHDQRGANKVKQIDVLEENIRQLLPVLSAPLNERRIALRGDKIYVERLVRQMPLLKSDLFYQIPVLSEQRLSAGPEEVEVEIKAIGLNRRDLNLVRENQNSNWSDIGLEFAGIVKSAGEKIDNFESGQRVMGVIFGGLRRYGLTRAEYIMPVPEKMSFEEAASMPYDYLTAHYALCYLTQIRQGERILIHNADNSTGFALIQIARHAEAEIFATVNHEDQIPFLKSMGVSHVFSNKTLRFIDEIFRITGNDGVDIIVNTASNEQLTNSFALLRDFGRFIELNPDVAFQQSIVYHNLRHNIAFFAIDLEHLAAQQPKLLKRLMQEVSDKVRQGIYKPLNPEIFDLRQIGMALTHLRTAHSPEKHVLNLERKTRDVEQQKVGLFRDQGFYLVVGQLDTNNLALIRWLHERGAKNIRVIPLLTEPANKKLPSYAEPVERITPELFEELNGIIISLNYPDAQNLNSVTETIKYIFDSSESKELDFVLSTVPFTLLNGDSAGKPIIPLNNFLISLHYRRQQSGLPSLHVQLGGKIPTDEKVAFARWEILKELLLIEKGNLILTEADWNAIFTKKDIKEIPAFFSDLLPQKIAGASTSPEAKSIERGDILSADPQQRFELVREYLTRVLAKVIKVQPAQINHTHALTQFGVDSLMAIELKNTVESNLGVNVPITTLLQGPSINDLTDKILEQLEGGVAQAPSLEISDKKQKQTEIVEFKLSHGQRAMYFQHTMNPGSVFNLAYAVRIRSDFDKELLRESFQSLIDRHPSLRTTFHLPNGEPIQRIHPTMPAFFVEEDLQDKNEEQVRRRLQEEVESHFDLENGPLMRIYLFRRAQNDYILLFVMHHIVTDIWSQAVLLDELSQIFEKNGDIGGLPPVVTDYTDFIRWQDDLLNSERGEQLFAYWSQKLSGELPVLNLPTDKPRPPVQTFKGKTEALWLPGELSNSVYEFCEQQGVTPFTVLLASYYILLHRYTGQDDIIVGSPTAGRSINEFARTVGYFVNPLPIRMRVNPRQPFLKFLEEVKKTTLDAFENMDYPLTLLVEKLHPRRDPSRTPLFQTMFVLERAHLLHDQGLSQFALSREGARLNLGGLTIESMNLEQGVAPFDLTLMAVESGKGFAVSFGYNVDLFEASTIRRMLQHYLNILSQIIENRDEPISKISVISESEFSELTSQLAASTSSDEVPEPVFKQFEQRAAENPEKIALIFEKQSVTYKILNQKANQLAHYLIERGVKTEDRVGICLDRSTEMVVSVLAVMKSGAAYVPIDPGYPQDRIQYMLNDSDLKLILTKKMFTAKLESHKERLCLLDELSPLADYPTDNPSVPVHPDNLAYVIYTSGSTGRPKGTLLQHRGLANTLKATTKRFWSDSETRQLQFASFSFDASVEETFRPLILGGTIALVRAESLLSLNDLTRVINENKITHITLPPSVLTVLPPEQFPTLKVVVSAGEKCTPEIVKKWKQSVSHFVNGYGPTEATICTTTYEVEDRFDNYSVPIGRPLDNMRIYVLDAQLNPVPRGVPGELYIAGTGLARGYHNRPDMTAERFLPDPFASEQGQRMYRTGDRVRFLPDGNLEFIDRIDEQIKIRGYRVELGEIEVVLESAPQVKDAVVVAKKTGSDLRLIAYVIPENSAEFDEAGVRLFLKKRIPDFMIPAIFVTMEKFPLTANGKVDKKALPEPEISGSERKVVRPGTDLERKLAQIWKEILHVDDVSIHDSFFDMGGHSLSIIQVQGKIREQMDIEIDVVDIFKYPTIHSLAQHLEDQNAKNKTLQKSMDRATKQREATSRMQQMRMRQRRKGV